MLIYFTERFGGNATDKTTTIESIHTDADEAHEHKRSCQAIDPDDSAVWMVVTANLYDKTWNEFVRERVANRGHELMKNFQGGISQKAKRRATEKGQAKQASAIPRYPQRGKPVLTIVK